MSQGVRIRTPWSRRWLQFRQRLVPWLTFFGTAVLVAWWWTEQAAVPTGIGEVEAVRVDVVARVDGILVPLVRPPASLFETVHAGQLVAQLDERPAQARLEAVRAEVAHLRKTLEAEGARIALSEADRRQEHLRDAARLAWELEQHRLSVLDRQATIEADRVVLQRLQARVSFLTPLHEQGLISDIEFSDEQLLLEEVVQRLDKNATALQECQQQQQAAAQRLAAFPPLVVAEVDALLTEIKTEIEAQEALMREIELEIESLQTRAPIAGTVVAVHRHPGQGVRAGDPILTIASEQGRHIVSYVPQNHNAPPTVGMRVQVRTRTAGSLPRESVVDRVGPQVEPIPAHQLSNPQTPQWGLPVRILLPDSLQVRPGELVDVTFNARHRDNPG